MMMKEAAKPIHPRLINDFSTLLSVEEQLVRKSTHRSITSEMAIKRCSLSKRSSPIGEVTVPSLADTSPNRNLCSCQPNMECVPYSNSRRIQCGGQSEPSIYKRYPHGTNRAIYKQESHQQLEPFIKSVATKNSVHLQAAQSMKNSSHLPRPTGANFKKCRQKN